MRELVSTLIEYQLAYFASGPRTATVFVTILDCLVFYALTLGARKKASQNELLIVIFAITVAVLTVLEFVGGGQ